MLERYLSKNSCYHFDEHDDLIASRNGKEKNLGKAIYVSTEEFKKALDDHQISPKKGYQIKKHIGDAFLKALRERQMHLKEKGGRFVTLIEEKDELLEGGYYFMRYGGVIINIEPINLNIMEIASETDIKINLD